MARNPNPPKPYAPYDENLAVLTDELRRRGMTDAEIEAALRKKKRRRGIEFEVLKTPHLVHDTLRPSRRSAHGRISAESCAVDEAATQLGLHPRTVLRFIREGRLPATRVGKSYRILRSQLEAFAGLPERGAAPREQPSVTSIVDIPEVDAELARTWSRTVTGALGGRSSRERPIRAEVIYEPERRHLKIVVCGAPDTTVNLLALIQVWIEQLSG
ncbi:MAG TPA: helix-turn-helix domain-containing protein [Caulobacteraceae bacterium]|jgi:excisionase family DNA binding protein